MALLTRTLGGPPFSFTVHGPEEFDRPEAESLPEKIREAGLVCAISSFGRSQLSRWSQFADWDKLRIVRCGLDESFLDHPTHPVPDVRQLVCIGRLVEQKGHFILVLAATELKRRGVAAQFVLVGDGEFRAALEAEIASRQLHEYFQLVGWQPNESIRTILEQSRGMVLPSFAEGLPVVIMEAFGRARPVISTYVAGIPELVLPGENGWLVPAGDPIALADAVEELLATPTGELNQRAEAGRSRVRDRHDINKEARTLADAIASMRTT